MTRAEFDKKKNDSDAFLRLIQHPDWKVIDEMLVKIVDDTNDIRLLDIPPDALSRVAEMAKGRLECIAVIRDYMSQWIADRELKPSAIDDEPSENAPSVPNS